MFYPTVSPNNGVSRYCQQHVWTNSASKINK